ncbi:TetR family transcriptional regulator [Microbispora rosea]|uniref:TetR/AcrR family transcriptional regulator n=1 Tax=Microbispora rosea TaxID=58117 RepID=UPI003442DE95
MTEAGARVTRAERRRRTEARILAAAARLFAESGYADTTIRAVAAAAGVNPGLVMHYFGSKEELFLSVARARPSGPLAGEPEQVVEEMLDRLAASMADEPVESLAVLRSMLTHPGASDAAAEGTARYRAQLAEAIPAADSGVRAALISAVMIGVVLGRHLLKLEELRDAPPEQIAELLRPCLRSLTGADG